jgi:hypothetical protein
MPSPLSGVKKHQPHHHKDHRKDYEIRHDAGQLSGKNIDADCSRHQADDGVLNDLVLLKHDGLPPLLVCDMPHRLGVNLLLQVEGDRSNPRSNFYAFAVRGQIDFGRWRLLLVYVRNDGSDQYHRTYDYEYPQDAHQCCPPL